MSSMIHAFTLFILGVVTAFPLFMSATSPLYAQSGPKTEQPTAISQNKTVQEKPASTGGDFSDQAKELPSSKHPSSTKQSKVIISSPSDLPLKNSAPLITVETAPSVPLVPCSPSGSTTIVAPTGDVTGPNNGTGRLTVNYNFKYLISCSQGSTSFCSVCYYYLIEKANSAGGWDFVDSSSSAGSWPCGTTNNSATTTVTRQETPGKYKITLKLNDSCTNFTTTYGSSSLVFNVIFKP